MMSAMSPDSDLVPGRECGPCTTCCRTLKIDAPELKKLADVVCPHCTEGGGCKIYANRPQVCQDWYCGWRKIPQLGLKFDIVDSPRVLNWDPLIKFIAWEITQGRPVFLGVPTPIGYERRKIFLNYAMAQAVQSRDRQAMLACLEAAYRVGLQEGLAEKTTFA